MSRTERRYSQVPLALAIAFIATVGCDSSRPNIVPVSGHVTIDGKPVAVGQITVMPEGHRASIGKIDPEGRFELSCFEAGDGAPIGQHIATVTAVEPINDRSNRWHAPKKYANKATGVWINVDGPTEDLKVELTWAGSNQTGPFVENF
jgi:hypothetical protein